MPEMPDAPRLVASAKDALAVAREALIVALFLLLVFWPTGFNSMLERAGFTKGSLLGFEWEKKIKASTEEAKGAGDAITQIQDRLQTLQKSLEATTGPDAAALKSQVRDLLQDTQKADQATKNSLATQQRLIAEVAPAAVETVGWIYLGKTTAAHDRWLGDQTTDDVSPPELKPGTRIRMRDSVYVRDNDGRDAKNLGRVVSVLPRGEQVVVQEVAYQPRATYVAVWARVQKV
jgi:ElaB/YqjD/DUF883 family membrane-anchored ribosome-binding protein